MRTRGRRAPAQVFAATVGGFLTVLGGLSLLFGSTRFDTIDATDAHATLLVWPVSGWNGLFWLILGAAGLLAMARLPSARVYALSTSVVFAAVALWGATDSRAVADLLVAGLVNDVMHAVLAFAGLMAGLAEADPPEEDDPDREDKQLVNGHEPVGRW
jgi:hypothetical protein